MTDPDHGNRYELTGVVADVAVLAPLADLHPRLCVVPLPAAGLGLVPIVAELATALVPAIAPTHEDPPSPGPPSAVLHTGPESGFAHLSPGLLSVLEAISVDGPVAYLEADYTGRDGHQAAAAWWKGTMMLGPLILGRSEVFVPRQAPISQVLRLLGVRGDWRRDEFVVAGLGLYRRTVDWT